jgi:hypothetical protein
MPKMVKMESFMAVMVAVLPAPVVVWIYLAKRPETREKRIRESIRLLMAGTGSV